MKLTQVLSTKQLMRLEQLLSPKMIQMMKLFNLSYLDLVGTISHELKENVALEVVQEDRLIDYVRPHIQKQMRQTDADISDFAVDTRGQSVYESVISQIDLMDLGTKEREIILLLAEGLDSRGFIPNYDAIKEKIKVQFGVQDRKVMAVLKILQSLEPEGVGARTLKECLLIQIESHDFENEALVAILKKIVTYHLDALGKGNFDGIAKNLGIPADGVKAAAEFIKNNLNPNPGQAYQSESYEQVLIPSFEVKIENDRLVVINLEQKMGVHLGVSETYLAMLGDNTLDEATRAFIKDKIQRAQSFIENIERRYENIEKLARYILEHQFYFLKKGTAYLEPLLQKQVAENLGLSPSTVSRIVASKSVQTPQGVFLLKQLCPRSLFGKTQERLKRMVLDLVQSHPQASDHYLTAILNGRGIPIARRTVNKYRHLNQKTL